MKEILTRVILGIMILTALSVCGIIVLKIFDVVLHIGLENIIYEVFKVGLVASVLLLIDYFRKRKAKA